MVSGRLGLGLLLFQEHKGLEGDKNSLLDKTLDRLLWAWLGPMLGHVLKSSVLARIPPSQFIKDPLHLVSDYPQYLNKFLIPSHPPGEIWSAWLTLVRILPSKFSKNPPYLWCFLLVTVHSLTPPPAPRLYQCPLFLVVFAVESSLSPLAQNPIGIVPTTLANCLK